MKRVTGYAEAKESGNGPKVVPGGYVVEILSVEDVAEKEYLKVVYDIKEGECAGYYAALHDKFDFWGLTSIRSYKEKALPMFKRFCSSVMRSNPGYVFNPDSAKASERDEKTLAGKLIGVVLQEEEYEKNNGEVGTRLIIAYECDAEKIRKGDFKVPEKKTLPVTNNDTSFMNIPAGDSETCPFD